MRNQRSRRSASPLAGSAALFAALGDETRLRLVRRLCDRGPASIASLKAGFGITRQAITKHLRVMQASGLARSTRHGRQSIWQLNERRLRAVRRQLASISKQWDAALGRLREFVES